MTKIKLKNTNQEYLKEAPQRPDDSFPAQSEAKQGAGSGRSADSLSLGHNGIKLITSQSDRV